MLDHLTVDPDDRRESTDSDSIDDYAATAVASMAT